MKIATPLLKIIIICSIFFTWSISPSNAQSTPDPGTAGTYSVSKAYYNLGDLAFKPPSFPKSVEVRGSVHYPSSLVGGPFPVIVLLHGRHETSFQTSNPNNTRLEWPCSAGYEPITSFEGYDYLAKNMASHGYIVISISCNAINASDNSLTDYGMQARGELLQYHLDLWNTYNTTGGTAFGTLFVGKLDMNNIGTMGHSRGGEGVVFNALYNKSLGSPYGIKAVLTLAPVDFIRKVLHGIPLLNIAPYCDGDVSNIQGVHFYDDARYSDTSDDAPKHSILMMGANHNFFNTVWTPGSYIAGGLDDWNYGYGDSAIHCGTASTSSKRYDTTKQKAALNAYASAFFRIYLGHETIFSPILEVDDIVPPISSKLDTSDVYVSYQAPKSKRLDINRTDSTTRLTTNTLAGNVTQNGLVSSGICGGGFTMVNCGVSSSYGQEPHKGTTTKIGLAQMRMRWDNDTDWYQNELPVAFQDITSFQSLLFRATVNFNETTIGTNLDFSILLIDSFGHISSQKVSNRSHALFFPPGKISTTLPKAAFNTIKIPLSDFVGVNLTKIKNIRFLFNKSNTGSILISDLALSGQVAPCGNFKASFTDSIGGSYKVLFTNKTTSNLGDSLVWNWHFDDISSGIKDTSTVSNPVHKYSGAGTYTPCLYVTNYRKTGKICTDTFCFKTILNVTSIPTETIDNVISIIPNPAKDYLYIKGAASTDLLEIINVYGQIVLKTTTYEQTVHLPQNIVPGVYYAILSSRNGRYYSKIIIER